MVNMSQLFTEAKVALVDISKLGISEVNINP